MILVRGSGNTIQEIHVFDAREKEGEGEKRRSEREKERRVYEGQKGEKSGGKREEERRQREPSIGGTSAAIKRSDKAAMFICVDRWGERSAV